MRVTTTPKRSSLAAVIFASILFDALSDMPGRAQVMLDMTVVTCGQYINAKPDRRDVIAAWMSGYVNAARGQKTVDITSFARNRMVVDKYCMSHKSEALMSAIQRNAL